MEQYKRNLFNIANQLLYHFPVVSIIGARQVGKTTLSKQLRQNWHYLDLENPNDFELLVRDPLLFFQQFPEHIIIDEAQLCPQLFNTLRGVIDNKRDQPGRFILTGSSSSELLTNISESLAGRTATLELGTLKANEFYQTKLSDFYILFTEKLNRNNLVTGKPTIPNKDMHCLWLKGGYPEPILKSNDFFYEQWMQNYLLNYVNRDIARLFPRLNKLKFQQFFKMLSKLSASIINKSDLARALEISEGSAREYLRIAEGTFLWRELMSFETNVVKSIIKMPKGYMRDTGLLHHLLNINSIEDLYTHPIVGQSFESFVIEEIIKGMQAIPIVNWNYHYFRTKRGIEVDLILTGKFGTLPVEIKYGTSVSRQNLTNLTRFIESHKLDFGIIINQAEETMWLTDKIYQIPLGWI